MKLQATVEPAAGGEGPGGDGGNGAIVGTPAMQGANAAVNFGGGGGGGSLGYLQSNNTTANVTASPAIVVVADP